MDKTRLRTMADRLAAETRAKFGLDEFSDAELAAFVCILVKSLPRTRLADQVKADLKSPVASKRYAARETSLLLFAQEQLVLLPSTLDPKGGLACLKEHLEKMLGKPPGT